MLLDKGESVLCGKGHPCVPVRAGELFPPVAKSEEGFVKLWFGQRSVVDIAELLLSFRGLCEEVFVAEQQVMFFGVREFAELGRPGFKEATFAGGSAEQENCEEGTAGDAKEGFSGRGSGLVHGVFPESVAGSAASFFRKAVSGICRMLW